VASLLAKGGAEGELVGAFGDWARQSPDEALEALLSDPRLQSDQNVSALFSALTDRDPAAALAALDRLPRKPWAAQAVKAVAQGWATKNPQAALQAGLSLPEGGRRRDFLSAACHTWLEKDVVAAAAWLKSLPPEISARSVIGKDHLFLGGMNDKNAVEKMNALVDVHRLAGASQNTWLHHDFMHWSSRDPETAVPWALALPLDTPKRDDIVRSALDHLAQDQDKALATLPTLTERKDRDNLVQSIASRWGAAEPEKAWAWAATLDEGAGRSQAITTIANTWASTDPEAAVAFLKQHRPETIAEWGSQAASTWIRNDPEAALAWVQTTPQESRQHLTLNALSSLSSDDPAKALDHVDLLTDNHSRQALLRQSIGELARQDVTSASQRLSTMPPSLDRDAAIQGLFEPAYEVEPDSALAWANSIHEPSARESLLSTGLSRWLTSDPAAAEDWWRRASIDPEVRQRLAPMVDKAVHNP